jgi:polysaccharide biosynthesis protein PslG
LGTSLRSSVISSRKFASLLGTLAMVAAGATALAPASAQGRARLAISDQHAETFGHPLFQRLDVKHARLIVPWDVLHVGFDRVAVDAWLNAARTSGIRPLVTFSHSRVHPRRRPSARQFKREFRAFREKYPWVREYSPWNEANHQSQPTYHHPRLAARYYNIVRSACPRCTVVALDVLDQPDMVRYVRVFQHWAKGRPRLWGLHNYRQVNRRLSTGTRKLLRNVRGRVWLTETGGIVNFGSTLHYNTARAARVTKYLFKSAKNPRIRRIYIYSWWGEKRGARFDAGLVGPNGEPRPAYYIVRRYVRG